MSRFSTSGLVVGGVTAGVLSAVFFGLSAINPFFLIPACVFAVSSIVQFSVAAARSRSYQPVWGGGGASTGVIAGSAAGLGLASGLALGSSLRSNNSSWWRPAPYYAPSRPFFSHSHHRHGPFVPHHAPLGRPMGVPAVHGQHVHQSFNPRHR